VTAIVEPMRPETRDAKNGDVNIAYEVAGEDPLDLVLDTAGDGFLATFDGPARAIACVITVKDLVAGSGLELEDRGAHELKGLPGEWRLYAVAGV
jgi:hypothetical protein